MSEVNLSIEHLDSYSILKEIFVKNGNKVKISKKEYFIRQNQLSAFVGWVESGTFHHTRITDNGDEHIVCFSFPSEFVCDYSSFIHKELSLVNIRAISDCTIYLLSHKDLISFWETDMATQRMGRNVAESMFKMTYVRLLELYCNSPEKRYLSLMQRCPDLKERVPLKDIASFLGVTPETVSHIRKKMLQK